MAIQCFTNLLDTNYLKPQQSLKRVSAIIAAIGAIGFEQERLGRRLHKDIFYPLNDKVIFVLGFVPRGVSILKTFWCRAFLYRTV